MFLGFFFFAQEINRGQFAHEKIHKLADAAESQQAASSAFRDMQTLLKPVFDEENNPVYEQKLDENGQPEVDENGNPVYVIATDAERMGLRARKPRAHW